jgi:hypothetical protein
MAAPARLASRSKARSAAHKAPKKVLNQKAEQYRADVTSDNDFPENASEWHSDLETAFRAGYWAAVNSLLVTAGEEPNENHE